MIYRTEYKSRPAIAITNNLLTAVFLALDGAKMISLKTADGKEMLEQAKAEEYKRLFLDSSYVDCECSAFDDMFPTIDPCEIGSLKYLDHGESCRIEHKCTTDENSIWFKGEIKSVNAVIYKKVYFVGDELHLSYQLENKNPFELPYIWAGHMMFVGEKGALVTENFQKTTKKTIMFGNVPEKINMLGEFKADGESYKYYHNEENSKLECGIIYPVSQKRVNLSFNGEAIKYLGVWINNGSFKGMYNIALEPCTALFDSPVNAKNAGKSSVIAPNGSVEFTVKIKIENI